MYHFRVQELESRSEVRHRPATRGCRGRPDGLRSQDLGEAGCDAALLCNGGVFMNARSFLALAGAGSAVAGLRAGGKHAGPAVFDQSACGATRH